MHNLAVRHKKNQCTAVYKYILHTKLTRHKEEHFYTFEILNMTGKTCFY